MARCLSCLGRAGAAAFAALALVAFAGEAMAKTFTLSITGDDDARYDGTCTVSGSAGDRTVELKGAVPLERTFEGDSLSCRLDTEDRIVAEIVHSSGRSRSESDGGTIQLSAR